MGVYLFRGSFIKDKPNNGPKKGPPKKPPFPKRITHRPHKCPTTTTKNTHFWASWSFEGVHVLLLVAFCSFLQLFWQLFVGENCANNCSVQYFLQKYILKTYNSKKQKCNNCAKDLEVLGTILQLKTKRRSPNNLAFLAKEQVLSLNNEFFS